MITKTFYLKGMSCAACKYHVTNAIKNINGVENVLVNLVNNDCIITFNEQLCSLNEFKLSLNKIGYDISDIKFLDNNKNYRLLKIIISFLLLIIVLYLSMGEMIGLRLPIFISKSLSPFYNGLFQIIFTIPICILNFNFYKSGITKLFKFIPNMDSLISIGSICSLIYGIYDVIMIYFGHLEYENMLYIDSCGMILCFVSLGKYLEFISKNKTILEIDKIKSLKPTICTLLKDEEEVLTNVDNVSINDTFVVKVGEQIPLDGIIIKGNGVVNESSITGESLPVDKKTNDTVFASTLLLDGYLICKSTTLSNNTEIANIIDLVLSSSYSKSNIENITDKISKYFVPIVLLISLITFISWILISNDFETAFNNSITLLVIACPCALGLATPVSIMVATGVAAKNKIIFKNATILENARLINNIVFDKTGTLTKGNLKVVKVNIINHDIDNLGLIYSIEKLSNHPIAESIKSYLKALYPNLYDIVDYKILIGSGIECRYNNDSYYIGKQTSVTKDFNNHYTKIIFTKNNELCCEIFLEDELRESSNKALLLLKKLNIKTSILSGDNSNVVSYISSILGIDSYKSNLLPIDKLNTIKDYKKTGDFVCMVGDGVNDSPSIIESNIGISLGNSTNLSCLSSDIVLLSNDLVDIFNAIKLSKLTYKTILLSLFWAFCYNIFGIIISTGITPLKINPMIASICMSISSVLVVTNALLINRFKPIIYQEKINEAIFRIDKMMCNHCEIKVNNITRLIPQVKDVSSSYKDKMLKIKYINNLDIDLLKELLSKSGYELKERIK